MKNLKKRRLWTTNTYKRISLGGAHHKNELGKGVRTSGLLVGDDYANTALSGQCKHLLALGTLPAALAPGGAQQLNPNAQVFKFSDRVGQARPISPVAANSLPLLVSAHMACAAKHP